MGHGQVQLGRLGPAIIPPAQHRLVELHHPAPSVQPPAPGQAARFFMIAAIGSTGVPQPLDHRSPRWGESLRRALDLHQSPLQRQQLPQRGHGHITAGDLKQIGRIGRSGAADAVPPKDRPLRP
ncbi:MAG: hypothetical protein ACK559_07825 [bacterium]